MVRAWRCCILHQQIVYDHEGRNDLLGRVKKLWDAEVWPTLMRVSERLLLLEAVSTLRASSGRKTRDGSWDSLKLSWGTQSAMLLLNGTIL